MWHWFLSEHVLWLSHCPSTIPCPSRPSPLCLLSWPRVEAEAHRGHTSSEDTLSCTNSSGQCLESAADYQIHISCDHVFLGGKKKFKYGGPNSEMATDNYYRVCFLNFLTQSLFDVASPPPLCSQLHWLEPRDVVCHRKNKQQTMN